MALLHPYSINNFTHFIWNNFWYTSLCEFIILIDTKHLKIMT